MRQLRAISLARFAALVGLLAAGLLVSPGVAHAAAPQCNQGKWTVTTLASYPYLYFPTYNGREPPSLNPCLLGVGSASGAVVALQNAMRKCHGQNIAADGIFGPATRQAVVNVQRAVGVTADGVYGPQTMWAMRWPPNATRSLNSAWRCYRLA